MVRTRQGGSVLSFVIGGVFLTALLVGGVYLISQQGHVQNTPMPPPAPQAPQKTEPSSESQVTSEQSQASVEQLPSDGPATHELPATGSRGVAATALVVAVLSGVTLSYVRSRRQITSL